MHQNTQGLKILCAIKHVHDSAISHHFYSLRTHLQECSSSPSKEHVMAAGGLLVRQSTVICVSVPLLLHSSKSGSTADLVQKTDW